MRADADDEGLPAMTPLPATRALAVSTLAAAERAALIAALRTHHGAVTRAAVELGIHPATLHRQLRRHGLTAWHRQTWPRSQRQPPR